MNVSAVLHIIGVLLVATGMAMVPPAAVAASEGLFLPWAGAIAVTEVLGASLWAATPREIMIGHREGLVVVGVGWLSVVTVGSLPFVFTGVAPGIVAALFESVSGFTTTGATIFPTIEELPRSILLWRSVSHWAGGMGIIVLGIAILPFLGLGGARLFQAEAPGIPSDRLTPRIASTARLLWAVYAGLTAVAAVTYLMLGMSPFEAINHAMSALATGGFSTRTASLAAFSPAIQWVTILFMFLAGVNFALHYRLLSGGWRRWIEDVELRSYAAVGMVAVGVCFVTLALQADRFTAGGIRDATFNVVAVLSTTGFATADFAAWPAVCQVILIALMFVGAMGGSTGGGFKMVRAVVVAKSMLSVFRIARHPKAIAITRLGGRVIAPELLLNVLGFLGLYVITHGVGTLLLTAQGYDLTTSVSAALAAMSSIGPGLGEVGPASDYGDLSSGAHLTLTALMLLGRLEFYTLLVLFVPGTWALATRARRR